MRISDEFLKLFLFSIRSDVNVKLYFHTFIKKYDSVRCQGDVQPLLYILCAAEKIYTRHIKCELNVHFALGTYQNHIFVGAELAQLSRLECFDLAASARLSTLISCGLRTLRSHWLRFLRLIRIHLSIFISLSLACSRHKLFKMWRIHSVWYELCSSYFLASFFRALSYWWR